MKNLTWQNPEQLFVAQELINKVKSKCCGIKDKQKLKAEEIKRKQRITATEAKKTEEYRSWNAAMLEEYAAKIDELKSSLTEQYQISKQQQLPDYPIFMAITEEIGYDSTGKNTATNELDFIGEELKKFIATL